MTAITIERVPSHTALHHHYPGEGRLEVWDAPGYFATVGSHTAQRRLLGITAATTDEELDALAEREDGEASGEGAVVVGIAEHLRTLRAGARAT